MPGQDATSSVDDLEDSSGSPQRRARAGDGSRISVLMRRRSVAARGHVEHPTAGVSTSRAGADGEDTVCAVLLTVMAGARPHDRRVCRMGVANSGASTARYSTEPASLVAAGAGLSCVLCCGPSGRGLAEGAMLFRPRRSGSGIEPGAGSGLVALSGVVAGYPDPGPWPPANQATRRYPWISGGQPAGTPSRA